MGHWSIGLQIPMDQWPIQLLLRRLNWFILCHNVNHFGAERMELSHNKAHCEIHYALIAMSFDRRKICECVSVHL